jgi:hypothetical protein
MDVARSLFDQFVFKVAEERGLDPFKSSVKWKQSHHFMQETHIT